MAYEREKTETLVVPDDNMQILVVEDNSIVSDYLKSILRRNFNPCSTTLVNNMAGCMACLKERQYQLILLDATLDLKAEDSCAAIRDVNTNTPIIMMVVSETKITHEYVIGCGADGIVYKPIEVEYLLREINRVIEMDLTQRGTDSSFFRAINLD